MEESRRPLVRRKPRRRKSALITCADQTGRHAVCLGYGMLTQKTSRWSAEVDNGGGNSGGKPGLWRNRTRGILVMSDMTSKAAVRKQLRDILAAMTDEQRHSQSLAACTH